MKLTTKFILYLTLFFSGIVLLFGIRSMVRIVSLSKQLGLKLPVQVTLIQAMLNLKRVKVVSAIKQPLQRQPRLIGTALLNPTILIRMCKIIPT